LLSPNIQKKYAVLITAALLLFLLIGVYLLISPPKDADDTSTFGVDGHTNISTSVDSQTVKSNSRIKVKNP
jgi:hypothetical protein